MLIVIFYALLIGSLWIMITLKKNTLNKKSQKKEILIKCGASLGIVYLLFLSQRIFYLQGWPTGIRYDFPGKLGEMFAILILVTASMKLLSELSTGRILTLSFKAVYCLLFLLVIIQNNFFFPIRESAQQNAQKTILFTQNLMQVKEKTSSHPDYPIIFQSFNVLDFEPVYSLNFFLRAYKVQNKTMLKINGYTSQSFSDKSLEKSLTLGLEETSINGGFGGIRAITEHR